LAVRSGETATVRPPWTLKAIGRRKAGGWIAVVRDGIGLLDKNNAEGFLGNPVENMPSMTLNDGAVGPDGRFYVGSVNTKVRDAADGSLYRVNVDGSIEVIETGLVFPNGISFSPDGRIMYVTEMWANIISAFDFDNHTGTVSHRRALLKVPMDEGSPDGLIVDADGFLWSAHWQGSRVTRYDPDGRKERQLMVSVPSVTCMAFGGSDLNTLYITTAKKGLSVEQLDGFPESGDLFSVQLDIQGRLEPEFQG
jgi:sugar lactone lactonase YvrE